MIGLDVLLGTFGSAIANLDEVNITLKGIKLEHVFETNDGLTDLLMKHFNRQVIFQFYKIIGSLDLLGSPVNLFSNIGTGVVEFFEMPIKGFVKGPLEGVKGLGKGAGSLVKNTIKGTFNSVSKISGSVATGLAVLSMVIFELILG